MGEVADLAVRRGVRAMMSLTDPGLERTTRAALARAQLTPLANLALSSVAEHLDEREPAVLVFDASAPNWLRIISDLVVTHPRVAPVMVAEMEHPEEFLAAVASGVVGFCSPMADVAALLRTIESVTYSGVAIPRALVAPLVEHVRHGRGRCVHSAAGPIDVTEREWEILQLMLQRRSTREMAASLFVSEGTVRSHVSALVKKLGALDRDDAVAMVERASL